MVASHIRLPVYLLQGKEKGSGTNLTTLFLGGEKTIPYLSNLLYSEEPRKEKIGKIFIWKIKSKLNLNHCRADLIFIKIDGLFSRFLARQEFIIIPEWVLFMLDLSKPLQEVWKLSKNKSLSEDLRRIRKHKYSYEITRDPAKFEYFYHQMYLPYIAKRYGKLMLLTDFHHMKRIFEKGVLLMVKKKNEYLAGNIIVMHNKSVLSAYIGIRQGKIEYLKQGALAASYYFTILWAKEKGYKWLDFGHCRPFLNDGVFCYKKKWGMEIKRSKRYRVVFGLKICNFYQGVQDFLTNSPFIFIYHGQFKGLILANGDYPLTLEETQFLLKKHSIPGLDRLIIFSSQGFTEEATAWATSDHSQKLHLLSMSPDLFIKRIPTILNLENFLDVVKKK